MTAKKTNAVSTARNQPVWGFDRLRSDALSRLLDDLSAAEQTGIPDELCKKVKKLLSEVVHLATEFPDQSPFRSSVFDVLQNFEEQYKKWNDIDGDSSEIHMQRNKQLKVLRKTRHKLAAVIRKNQHIIQENLDLTLIDSVYESIGDAVRAGPNILVNLSKAAARYAERRVV